MMGDHSENDGPQFQECNVTTVAEVGDHIADSR